MDAVLRAAVIYFILLVLVRLTGKRSLGQMTTFDFVLLLIIAEATQQGLLGNDFSLTNAFLAILTLVGIDTGLSLLERRSGAVDKLVNGVPLVIVEDGEPIEDRMNKARVSADDVLEMARAARGGAHGADQVRRPGAQRRHLGDTQVGRAFVEPLNAKFHEVPFHALR
jgi:uncharacterized membrane protein YcaP (DUF421 family)